MSSAMASTDRAALLALFRSTRGSGWKNSNNWNTAAPLSDWYGVRVDGEGRVVELRLQDNNLRGSIPKELGGLAKLKVLRLDDNKLTGSIPKELGGLLNLEDLRLNGNKLAGVIPTELGRLVTLRILYLYGNGLTGSIPKELGGLLNLEDLRLRGNKLTGVIPTEFGRLVTLRILYLHGNGLTGSIPKELGGLLNLEDLQLYNNRLTGVIPNELGRLVTLQKLYLFGNGFTGSIPKELGGLLNLEDLQLSNNRLTGVIPTELGRLVTLRKLYLHGNGLTGSVPEELGDPVKLEELRLDDNKLTGHIPKELGRLVTLRTLDLAGNGLTGVIPEELGGLSKLEKLWVGGNMLSGGVPRSLLDHPNRKEGGEFFFHVTEDGAPVPAYKSWKSVVIQLVLGYADVGTDVDAVVSYYQARHMWWFALGMIFILGPALFAAIVLLRREHWLRRGLVALQLGMLFEAFASWYDSTYSPTLASLRMMEPLYESVPQLMLQLYGLLVEWDNDGTRWLSRRLLSIVFSCFSLAYATTGLVAEQPLSRLSPTANASSAGCPSLTGLLFGAVPATDSSVAVYRSRWNSQNFIWAFLLYQVLEIGAKFISLALLAVVWRAYFFLALLWLWGSRALILHRLLAGEGVSRVRSQFRLVGMPFMDSVTDTLNSYDRGCALTTVEFMFCLTIGNIFFTNEGGQLPADIGRVWTYVAVVCMAGKLGLGYLIVRPFKRVIRFGTEQEEQTSGRQHGGGDVGGNGDVDPGGSCRGDDGGMLGGTSERTGDGEEGSSVVSALAGAERRRGARVLESMPFSLAETKGTLSWTAREEKEGASEGVGGLDRQGEPGSADSSAGLEMLTGMEEGKVASEAARSEGTGVQQVAQALTTVATGSASDGAEVQAKDDSA